MKRICVFCGSSNGQTKIYTEQAKQVGHYLAQNSIGLVYGGGRVGVMGAVANAVLELGGDVIGVIPKSLVTAEVAHHEVTKLHIVEGMHERKKMMYDFSDAFMVLPGGMGTLDEMFEILTWAQLQYHSKPVFILNSFGFFDDLLSYLNKCNREGFIKNEHLHLFKVIKDFKEITL